MRPCCCADGISCTFGTLSFEKDNLCRRLSGYRTRTEEDRGQRTRVTTKHCRALHHAELVPALRDGGEQALSQDSLGRVRCRDGQLIEARVSGRNEGRIFERVAQLEANEVSVATRQRRESSKRHARRSRDEHEKIRPLLHSSFIDTRTHTRTPMHTHSFIA
jgi:hypothetical protein